VNDGDIADELEAAVERGLGVVRVPFSSLDLGLTLGEQLGADLTPRDYEGVVWSSPTASIASVPDGTLLRVAANHLETTICDDLGFE
jgi:hypothetical protein